jgi:hypothetical protein
MIHTQQVHILIFRSVKVSEFLNTMQKNTYVKKKKKRKNK